MKTLLLIAGGERVFMDACPAAFSFRSQEHSVRRLSAVAMATLPRHQPPLLPPPPPRQSTDIRPSLSTRRSRFRYAYIYSPFARSWLANVDEYRRTVTNVAEYRRATTRAYTIMTILTERLNFFFLFFGDQDSTEVKNRAKDLSWDK